VIIKFHFLNRKLSKESIMALYINTNQSSLNAQRKLSSTSNSLSTSFERLSSGLRINSAKDDAAGLSITTRFTAQVNGLNQAVRNSNDGISLAQTAEGALNETTNILQRIRQLSVQSANDTNNDKDRASLQSEVDQLKEELNRIADTTNFNGNKVLDGNFLARDLQVGANVGETISVSIAGAGTADLARQARYSSDDGFVNGTNIAAGLEVTGYLGTAEIRNTVPADDRVSTTLNDASAIAKARAINASTDATGVRAIVGETEVTLGSVVAAGTLNETNFLIVNDEKIAGFNVQDNDASGALVDAINAVSDDTGVVASLNADSQLSLLAVDGRNIEVEYFGGAATIAGNTAAPDKALLLSNGSLTVSTAEITLQSDELFEVTGGSVIGFDDGLYGVNSDFSVSSVDISTRRGSVVALDVIDLALEDISSQRADLGALQNRLESTINNLSTTSENLSAARSRILDADFAQETAQLSRNQIIQQAGVSILAQANQQPQIALSLLG
jgi:flagellin